MRTGILKSPVGNLRKVPDKAPSWRGELTDSCRNRCKVVVLCPALTLWNTVTWTSVTCGGFVLRAGRGDQLPFQSDGAALGLFASLCSVRLIVSWLNRPGEAWTVRVRTRLP